MTKKTLPKEHCRGQMAKIREGRDLQSGTPQDSDLKTYSAPNREG